MESSRVESLALVAAVVGAAILGSQSLSIGFGATAIGDIAILLTLFAFDDSTMRSGAQSLAFAAVGGFCLLAPLLFLGNVILGAALPQGSPWPLSGLWLITALVLFSVDRFRMSSRDNVSLSHGGLSAAGTMTPLTTSAAMSSYRPAPIRSEAVAEPVAAQPVATAAPVYEPVPAPPTVLFSAPDFAATTIAYPAAQPPAAGVASGPISNASQAPIARGREAMIYLNLVGEGINVLRTVRAENLGRDYYRIADVMPDGEQWEFTPGMVVRCRKKSLSNGKHMVAFEEAPRAQ